MVLSANPRTFEEIQPDVAHIHCEAQGLLIALAATFSRRGIRSIIRTVHSIFQYDWIPAC